MPVFEKVKMEMQANEPWPKDVKLFQPYEVEQILLPENASCLAVRAYLKMSNLNFDVNMRANAEAMSPSNKVPFIKCGQFLISELEGIVLFCQNKGISLSSGLDNAEKSDMRAYMSLIHSVLEPAENYVCFMDSETYSKVTKSRCGSVYPFPLNHIKAYEKRSAELKKLKLMNWHTKNLQEVYDEVQKCCQSLSDRLGNNEYFFGSKYTEFDALVYGHFLTILTNPLPFDDNQFMLKVGEFDKLVNFTKKFDQNVMGQNTEFVLKKYSEMTDDERNGPYKKQEEGSPPSDSDPCNVCPPPETTDGDGEGGEAAAAEPPPAEEESPPPAPPPAEEEMEKAEAAPVSGSAPPPPPEEES